MQPFAFHPELFEHRTRALDALAECGFLWLSHFGSVDMRHDVFGLEVCAIRDEADARAIERLLLRLFPTWRHRRRYYEDVNAGEIGWKVVIQRDPEGCDDAW
jgi:hypothetical protein